MSSVRIPVSQYGSTANSNQNGRKIKPLMVVGQMKPVKPSRSDEVLSPDEQLKIAEQVRAQFDSAAPKRPIKPSRSDPDSNPVPYFVVDQQPTIPELDKFRSLESQSAAVILSAQGDPTVEDEFVDTEYYKELNSIDKQHHTTGTGFIRAVREEGSEADGLHLHLPESHARVGSKIKSNPATNDWTPRNDDDDDDAWI
ncbi:hypothetical protein ACFX2B_027188 [Malus domestica]